MGLKNWFKGQNERHKDYMDELRRGIGGTYGAFRLFNGVLHGNFEKRPIAGAVAEFEAGADQNRTTVTRVAAGAIIAGPAGAVVGGLLRKDKTRVYVTVTFPNQDVVIIDGPVKDEKKLRQFTIVLNNASRHFSESQP